MAELTHVPFYEHFGIYPRLPGDDRTLVEDLFKRPARVTPDHIHVSQAGAVQQADLLFLPQDGPYQYALVAVDLATRACDAEPLTSKTAKEVLDAFKKMYIRGPLTIPQRLELDGGSEFKSTVGKFFRDRGTVVRTSVPGRHTQQAMVENLNRILGTAIFKRQIAEELVTGKQATAWVKDLPKFIALINAKLTRAPPPPIDPDTPPRTESRYILDEGQKVRVRLDRPQSVLGEKLSGPFRAHDIRWSPSVHQIEQVLMYPGQLVRYLVSGIPNASYSAAQLQVVDGRAAPSSPHPAALVAELVRREPELRPAPRRSTRLAGETSRTAQPASAAAGPADDGTVGSTTGIDASTTGPRRSGRIRGSASGSTTSRGTR
jgi:hypothetical protein